MICVLMWSPDTTVIGNSSLHLLIKEHWCRCRSVGTPLLQHVWFVHCILAKIRLFKEKSAPLLPTVSLKLIELLAPHLSLCHWVGLAFLLDEGARPTTGSLPVSCVLCVQQVAWRTVLVACACWHTMQLRGVLLRCSTEQWDSARGV